MFWRKKLKPPITETDQAWINECLDWLRLELGTNHFSELKTVTPTSDFYNRTFTGNEDDAHFILQRTMELMRIENQIVTLEFFSDEPVYMSDGTILSTLADYNGEWESAAGTYEEKENNIIISIERGQLKNPISLIATMSHELSHLILLGENRLVDNDEYLTDITALVYGFGIFVGNSRFQFSSYSNSSGFGWNSSSQGYLPEQIIAYTMALLSVERNENTDYSKFLNKSMLKYFNQSLSYLVPGRKQTVFII